MSWWTRQTWWSLFALLTLASSPAISAPPKSPVVGPMLLCFKHSTFNLLAGERVADFSGGFERMSLTIDGPSDVYTIAESEIFASIRRALRPVFSSDTTHVFRALGGHPKYAIYGRPSFSPDQDRLVIWLSGPALKGSNEDAAIYSRFDVRSIDYDKCGHGFTYSWL